MSSCIPEKGNLETFYIVFLKWIDRILTEQTKHWMCHCLSKALSALKDPIVTHLVQCQIQIKGFEKKIPISMNDVIF